MGIKVESYKRLDGEEEKYLDSLLIDRNWNDFISSMITVINSGYLERKDSFARYINSCLDEICVDLESIICVKTSKVYEGIEGEIYLTTGMQRVATNPLNKFSLIDKELFLICLIKIKENCNELVDNYDFKQLDKQINRLQRHIRYIKRISNKK